VGEDRGSQPQSSPDKTIVPNEDRQS